MPTKGRSHTAPAARRRRVPPPPTARATPGRPPPQRPSNAARGSPPRTSGSGRGSRADGGVRPAPADHREFGTHEPQERGARDVRPGENVLLPAVGGAVDRSDASPHRGRNSDR